MMTSIDVVKSDTKVRTVVGQLFPEEVEKERGSNA